MPVEQKLWEVLIHYDAHHVDGTSPIESSYRVIGKDQSEALQKARAMFSKIGKDTKKLVEEGIYDTREWRLDNYSESVVEYRTPVFIPTIDGKDSKKFKLMPNIRTSNGHSNIEYMVYEK